MSNSTAPTHLPLVLGALGLAAWGCKVADPPPITGPWTDNFERDSIGANYKPTADAYQLTNGVLEVKGAFNHPLWLRKKLPEQVAVELDVWVTSPDGDLKVEIFGDGESHAVDKGAYTSSGYVLCMGGWHNSKSFIARGNEHASDMPIRVQPKVVIGQKYRWKIVRQGGRLDWYVDDMSTPFLSLDDSAPLRGAGHDYFGFNNWQSHAHFDNLSVTPL
jgi:hypothetical protein